IYDSNALRLKGANELLKAEIPSFTDFDEMLKKAKPDAVLIASRDSTHAENIIRTMEAGKRAISEKPLCVDGKQCRDILAAAQKYRPKGADCFVTHNMRYGPSIIELKKVLESGAIGE